MKLKGLPYQFFCALGCVAENSSVREVARETWPQLNSMGNMFRKPWRSVNRKRKLGKDVLRNFYLVYRTLIGTNNSPMNLTGFESEDFSPAVALSSYAGTLNKCHAVDLTCTGVTKTNTLTEEGSKCQSLVCLFGKID
jgi:hypothetical protein